MTSLNKLTPAEYYEMVKNNILQSDSYKQVETEQGCELIFRCGKIFVWVKSDKVTVLNLEPASVSAMWYSSNDLEYAKDLAYKMIENLHGSTSTTESSVSAQSNDKMNLSQSQLEEMLKAVGNDKTKLRVVIVRTDTESTDLYKAAYLINRTLQAKFIGVLISSTGFPKFTRTESIEQFKLLALQTLNNATKD